MAGFIREKTTYCGDHIKEIDIIPYSDGQAEYAGSGRSRKRVAVSAPKQKNLNDKNARRYLTQLLNANFSEPGSGYHVTLTYDSYSLPETVDEADKLAGNFLRRLKGLYRKLGAELKFVLITSFRTRGDKPTRIHHHVVINTAPGISPRDIRQCWRKPKKKGEKCGEMLGRVNADELQPDESGLTGLAEYLKNQPRECSKRRWRSSKNLRKPETVQPNDDRYSFKQVAKLAISPFDLGYWERKYRGWTIARPYDHSFKISYNEISGCWYIHILLRKKE